MNDHDKSNLQFLISLTEKQFSAFYMERPTEEKIYIDSILKIHLKEIEVQKYIASVLKSYDEMEFESVGENEHEVEYDVSDAKRELKRIMDL